MGINLWQCYSSADTFSELGTCNFFFFNAYGGKNSFFSVRLGSESLLKNKVEVLNLKLLTKG